jgi:3-isopropylmalate/(R)-2-methylmalate dehydratase large subunit
MAMEFAGETLASLNMEERMTITNMAIEAGAKNGIIEPDAVTEQYVHLRTDKPYEVVRGDGDAKVIDVMEFDVRNIQPTVAQPHSPANKATARDLRNVAIDRVYIGSCTGGKTTDFIAAARVLVGKRTRVETFIVPATTDVDMDMDIHKVNGKTLREIFTAAGCKIGPASCAACLGGPEDTFGRANTPIKVVSTTNRNFPGRMGHKGSSVFLASPLTAAASAITGRITDPRQYVNFNAPVGLVQGR